MAFNPIERLEQGNVSFLWKLSFEDRKRLINYIRESPNRNNIVKGFLKKLKRHLPYFCFEIIYDMDEYTKDTFELVKGNLGVKVGYKNLINEAEKIKNILYNTSWGHAFVLRNLNNILRANKDNIDPILDYTFDDFEKNQDFIKRLSRYHNLHTRYLFMKYLVEKHPDKIDLVYDDIMKYLTNYTYEENEQLTLLPDLMNSEDISKLAIYSLMFNPNKSLWYKLKEYILANYKTNDLASLLLYRTDLRDIVLGEKDLEQEFEMDADRLFESANTHKHMIYERYKEQLSSELVKRFEYYLNLFKSKEKDKFLATYTAYSLSLNGLWNEVVSYVDKYLPISKDQTSEYLTSGSTAVCYRIGDYVFKIFKSKWSYEDVICPDLYLIAKNFEEHYIRNKHGVVIGGIEVQKYLSSKDIKITSEHLRLFTEALKKAGYYVNDSLMHGRCGDNVAILDSYLDADTENPENLPDWFKETPLVLVDRDMVYRLENKQPRQLKECLD